jgi:hypothetical protein
MKETPVKAVKAYRLKPKNKRIELVVYDNNCVVVNSRTLINAKDRIIASTSNVYSLETFILLTDLFTLVKDDPKFKKATNREVGQMQKGKRPTLEVFDIGD